MKINGIELLIQKPMSISSVNCCSHVTDFETLEKDCNGNMPTFKLSFEVVSHICYNLDIY